MFLLFAFCLLFFLWLVLFFQDITGGYLTLITENANGKKKGGGAPSTYDIRNLSPTNRQAQFNNFRSYPRYQKRKDIECIARQIFY
jgi:hypothetical protein